MKIQKLIHTIDSDQKNFFLMFYSVVYLANPEQRANISHSFGADLFIIGINKKNGLDNRLGFFLSVLSLSLSRIMLSIANYGGLDF